MRAHEGDDATLADLGQAADACPWATFFQTPDWLSRAATLLPNHALRIHRLEVDGATVLWPMYERMKGHDLDVRGNAAGVYGGWVAREPVTVEQGAALLAWFEDRCDALRLRMNPFMPGWTPEGLEPLGTREADETFLMDLRLTSEQAWTRYAGGMRGNINKAKREGVVVRQATGEEDWQAFGALYDESTARWRAEASGGYSSTFLASFSNAPSSRLYIAELEGRPLAAALHFLHGGHLLGWKMGASESGQKTYAWKLLVHETIEDCRRRGLRWYDFNVSGGHAGSDQWKRLFGGEARLSPMVHREARPTAWDRISARWRRPGHPAPGA